MCGILGMVTLKGRHEKPEVFEFALNQMEHRGPDDSGILHKQISDKSYLSFGHRRLSILDLSHAGHQPMVSDNTGNVMVYNGEVYNFQEIKKTLKKKGYKFKSNCDTEVILSLYDDIGNKFVDQLNGMFALGIWNSKTNELLIARDRMGIKPLYYYWDNKRLIFSSEIMAMAALQVINLEIDEDALRQYLMYNHISSPMSIFKNVKKLLPGHFLELDINNGIFKESVYWDVFDFYKQESKYNDVDDIYESVLEELTKSVKMRLISDVPLGIFLSGGIDSSLLLSLMRKVHNGAVKTFTIGFEEDQWNEAPKANKIAEFFGTEHKELYFSKESILSVVRESSQYLDEPLSDPAFIPTLALSRFTKKHVTVALSGDGGDELFCGYNHYNLPAYLRLAYDYMPTFLRSFLSGALKNLRHEKAGNLGYLLGHNSKLKYHMSRKCWDPARYYKDLHKHNSDIDRQFEIAEEVVNKLNDRSWQTQCAAIDVKGLLADQLLSKTDMASMSVSLEVRVPILDHKLVELAAGIPSKFKCPDNKLKFILKKLLHSQVPSELWDYPKHGFSVPLSPWFKGILKSWVYDELFNNRNDVFDHIEKKELLSAFNDHAAGLRDTSRLLWTCLQFAGWQKKLYEIRTTSASIRNRILD